MKHALALFLKTSPPCPEHRSANNQMNCVVERFFPNPAWSPTLHEFIEIESFPLIPDLFTHLPVKEDAATSARNAAAFSELAYRGIDVGAFTVVSAGFMRPDLLADPEFSARVQIPSSPLE